MEAQTRLAVGSIVRITRTNFLDGSPPSRRQTAVVSTNTDTETFEARITRVVENENGQQCYVEEINGDRTQAFNYPPSASFEVEILEEKNAPAPISFEVPTDKIVRGREYTTADTTEHVAEWNGQQYVVRRKDRTYRYYEVTATPNGDVKATLETDIFLSLAEEKRGTNEAENELKDAYREEMRAVARAFRNAF